MLYKVRLKFLKNNIILWPKTAILLSQFCKILVLGPHFWWSGGPGPPGPLDLPLIYSKAGTKRDFRGQEFFAGRTSEPNANLEGISLKNMVDDIKQNIAMYLLCSKHKCDFLKVQT